MYCRLIRAQGLLFLLVLRYLHKEVGKLLARVETVLVAAQLKFGVDILCDIEYTVTVIGGFGGYTGKYVLTDIASGDFFYTRNIVKQFALCNPLNIQFSVKHAVSVFRI